MLSNQLKIWRLEIVQAKRLEKCPLKNHYRFKNGRTSGGENRIWITWRAPLQIYILLLFGESFYLWLITKVRELRCGFFRISPIFKVLFYSTFLPKYLKESVVTLNSIFVRVFDSTFNFHVALLLPNSQEIWYANCSRIPFTMVRVGY